MAEISSESQFFSGSIANMIPEGPLNKMVPLTEDHGGGGGGGRAPTLAQGLIAMVTICYMNKPRVWLMHILYLPLVINFIRYLWMKTGDAGMYYRGLYSETRIIAWLEVTIFE